jgi:quercetin dioxygenase-like cupin family protein
MSNGNRAIPQEKIIRGATKRWGDLAPGVSLQMFASADCGAKGLCTAMATFAPGAALPYHLHQFSEAVTVVEGNASIKVEGRAYLLDRLDCIHIPKGVPHLAVNVSATNPLKLLSAFANAQPAREVTDIDYPVVNRGHDNPSPGDPEHIQRFSQAEKYELAEGTQFYDLFAGRFGAVGICGGYGLFAPGASLPCHIHDFGESITIVSGEAVCQAAGNRHFLRNFDTAFIPQGRPHRFLNEARAGMAMIWVYAGSEPRRKLVEPGYCNGVVEWDGSQIEESGV